jgi:hypothetical protein
MVNSILWYNYLGQISGSPDQVTYCVIMGGYPGIGNIGLYPEFVDTTWNDYRLQWGSPCIDAGDPAPQYHDPDGTRNDMGCFYYDQTIPVRVLLTPHNMPIQIPAGGGDFIYTLHATNIDPVFYLVTAWCEVTLPDGSIYGPVLGPLSALLGPEETRSAERTQTVPAGAPAGLYSYNAYATAYTDTSTDSFTFVKLETDGSDGLAGWFNTGESFDDLATAMGSTIPETYSLKQNYPNPFNPVTTISFELPTVEFVHLAIYDVSGRMVTELINGWRDTGVHEVIFDGSGLVSGVYIYRLEANGFTASGKMVLMK